MNLLIVDDERIAREGLVAQVQALLPSVTCFEADSILTSRPVLDAEGIDAVFLDLEMPGGHGITYLPELHAMKIPVVLVTGYENFGSEAFDYDVVDYLLKPFDNERLRRCIVRLSERVRSGQSSEVVLFSDQSQCWPVNVREITLVEASGSYVTIHTESGRELTLTRSLKEVSPLLSESLFVRANRSQIVRLDCLDSIKKEKGGLLVGRLPNGQSIKFSRRQAQAMRQKFRF
ncbi:LytR/AlgR family response regulator transcription factor [Roseibacillus persicicus]|uniref:DNA-binding response regulator n=1 Tax=Roseibacillus persicicus TaxID=454148 RepID=A0A918TRV8_9BACT|nr:LytTR family DNA-binding domain-containing protein [Roseibacillus persicicus]MDQ8191596.1 LytTR family DNA-binding domain-containing protein [Roseibacillus persicicus]GHC60657.1 DNA-binding response regulator [Roseibacillus persicicus]